jgi:dTDP-4-dehydrorhamnose reductase
LLFGIFIGLFSRFCSAPPSCLRETPSTDKWLSEAKPSARLIADAVVRIVDDPGPLVERFRAARGLVNVAGADESSWRGLAAAIVEALNARRVASRVRTVWPIRTHDYPAKARRPANSRFDLARLREVLGVENAGLVRRARTQAR